MVTPIRRPSGFTLVETMVAIAIVGVLFLIGPTFLHQVTGFYQTQSTKITLQRDGRDLADLLLRFLRDAKASSVTIDQINTPQQPPFSRITFTTIQGTTMQYYQQGSSIIQTSQPQGSAVVNTSTLSQKLYTLTFTYPRADDPSLLSVSITLAGTISATNSQLFEINVHKIHLMNS